MTQEVLYFAYGSNLDLQQAIRRCPSIRVVKAAKLSNHRLCFPIASRRRECLVASVEPNLGDDVWGIIYSLSKTDLAHLDICEGKKYNREQVTIDGLDVFLYVHNTSDQEYTTTSPEYLQQILEGARAHELPNAYIQRIQEQAPL